MAIKKDETQIPTAKRSKKDSNQVTLVFLQGILAIARSAIETFGWIGALLIGGLVFVVWYATLEQKQAIIDIFILGRGASGIWPGIVEAVLFVVVAWTQHRYYEKKLASLNAELDRVGIEKGEWQERALNAPLPHAVPRTNSRSKKRG